ncbi:MAG: hypothetical protein V1753_07975 [Pseudomonadota bacterium]
MPKNPAAKHSVCYAREAAFLCSFYTDSPQATKGGVMHSLSAGGVFARGWLGFARKPYAIVPLARQDGKAKTVTARLPALWEKVLTSLLIKPIL